MLFLINYIPTFLLNNVCPYEKVNGRLCDHSDLHVFEFLFYSIAFIAHRTKVDSHIVHGIFLKI